MSSSSIRQRARDQNPGLQVEEAKRLGVKSENIYVEKASGSRGDRPVLAEALAACQKGDTFACWKLDRVLAGIRHARGEGAARPRNRDPDNLKRALGAARA